MLAENGEIGGQHLSFSTGLQLPLHALDAVAENGQGVAELVSQAGRHHARGRQALGAAHLAFELRLHASVTQDEGIAQGRSTFVADHALREADRVGVSCAVHPPRLVIDYGSAFEHLASYVRRLGLPPLARREEQLVDVATKCFRCRIAEERFRATVPDTHSSLLVQADDRVSGVLQDAR